MSVFRFCPVFVRFTSEMQYNSSVATHFHSILFKKKKMELDNQTSVFLPSLAQMCATLNTIPQYKRDWCFALDTRTNSPHLNCSRNQFVSRLQDDLADNALVLRDFRFGFKKRLNSPDNHELRHNRHARLMKTLVITSTLCITSGWICSSRFKTQHCLSLKHWL